MKIKISITFFVFSLAIMTLPAHAQSDKNAGYAFGEFASPQAKDVGPKQVKKICGDNPCSFNTNFGGREMAVQPPGIKAGKEINIDSAVKKASKRKGQTRVPNARRVP